MIHNGMEEGHAKLFHIHKTFITILCTTVVLPSHSCQNCVSFMCIDYE